MRATGIATALAAFVFMTAVWADEPKDNGSEMDSMTIEEKRQEIDRMSEKTMNKLLATKSDASALYDEAYGYAVFQVVKVAVGVTAGGGEGVALPKQDMDNRTYMKMATGGVGVGLGGQKYRTIFFFENKEAFDEFVSNGWEADAEAQAVAGNRGANVAASFSDGVAIYQITDKGLLANADISGTKYWVDEKLNEDFAEDDRTDD